MGTGAAIKTQLIARFTEMANNTIIGVYVSNSDSELGGRAYTGIISKVGTIGTVVLNSIDSPSAITARFYNGDLSGWRWANPPMVDGVEYALWDTYNGKPVYTMYKRYSSLPEQTSQKKFQITPYIIYPFAVTLQVSNNITGNVPYIKSYYTENNNITVETTKTVTTSFGVVVKYTKTA